MSQPAPGITPADYQTLRRELPHSIELSRNAKGEYSWSIKVYFEGSTIDQEWALNAVRKFDQALRDLYITTKEQP